MVIIHTHKKAITQPLSASLPRGYEDHQEQLSWHETDPTFPLQCHPWIMEIH